MDTTVIIALSVGIPAIIIVAIDAYWDSRNK